MEELISFFTLRPVFTHFGLSVVWYLYLLNAFIRVYIAFSTIYSGFCRSEA